MPDTPQRGEPDFLHIAGEIERQRASDVLENEQRRIGNLRADAVAGKNRQLQHVSAAGSRRTWLLPYSENGPVGHRQRNALKSLRIAIRVTGFRNFGFRIVSQTRRSERICSEFRNCIWAGPGLATSCESSYKHSLALF